MSMYRILALLVIMATLQTTSKGHRDLQAAAPLPAAKRCDFTEVHRNTGWKIVGLSGAMTKRGRDSIEGMPGVFLASLRPGNAVGTLLLPDCSNDGSGRLSLNPRMVKALEIWKIDFNGSVFGYAVKYEFQSRQKGIPRPSLQFTRVMFYDVDGSGRFTVLRYANYPHFLVSIEVPEWARRETKE